MKAPTFLSVDLAFGRHQNSWVLPPAGPVLITGPNGSGKTTLVDGLLRTIYGFRRRLEEDRRLFAAREPWDAEIFRSAVRLRRASGEVLSWARDHETDEVEVRRAGGELLFQGVANPTSTGSSDREYWELVEATFGIGKLEDYARTACIGQGTMLGTTFGSELLRLAEGGHARLQTALDRIADRHKTLTREPVSADARRLNADRRLERDRRELAEVERRLALVDAARSDHREAEERLAGVDQEAGAVDAELERLERARTDLAERRRLEAEAEAAGQRLDHLVELSEELEVAQREVREAERECETHRAFERYPSDFPSVADRLRAAWGEDERVRGQVAATGAALEAAAPRASDTLLPPIAGLVAVAAVAAALAGSLTGGVLALVWLTALGAAAAGVLGLSRAAERRGTHRALLAQLGRERQELESVQARIREALAGIPDSDGLSPQALEQRLERFERARVAFRHRDEARRRHRDAIRRVEESAEAQATPGRSLALLINDAQRRLDEVDRLRRQLEDARPTADAADVPPSARALDDALRERRRHRETLRDERESLRIRLDRASRALSDAAQLEQQAAELRRRIHEAQAAANALREAHALLRDGYAEFRNHDETRLVTAVSARLASLGDPVLAPFRTENGLGDPSVELEGRRVAIDSLALSHGQRHLVMLAVRLGAADFLADGGPAPPLIVDEPFAHLDDDHAAQVWNLLREISGDRQVVVTTQEAGLLERLGAEPAIRLTRTRTTTAAPGLKVSG